MATPLSQIYSDFTIQLEHIIPLNFDSIHNNLPDSHVWTTTQAEPESPKKFPTDSYSVPVIDLMSPNVVENMKNACQKWGMFHVTNHGIPTSLLEEVESHTKRLFDLPTEQKLKALRSPNGATGYGVARISPFFTKLMWHEGFTIMGSAVEHATLLWPNEHQQFCDAMDIYQKRLKSLSFVILLIILKALGVDEDQENTSSFYQSEGAVQLNSYPCCPNPSQAIGLAPHTDSSLITILQQNDTSGLQIKQDGVGWIPVTPVPGSLLINLGDLMHIISNATFKAAYHRVVPNETSHRLTSAYFYGPSMDSVVAPLVKTPYPRFQPVTAKEYKILKSKHLDKALSFVMID